MKKLILFAVLVVLVIAYVWRAPLAVLLMGRVIERNMTAQLMDKLPHGLHVALCGAGSPMPDPKRSGPCAAVIAGSSVLVFDVGSGASANIGALGIAQGSIDAIFLTHFHSDHIDGLGELLMQRWVGASHTDPVSVYGPEGVTRVVAGFNEAYALDDSYRTAHHGEQVAPPSGSQTLAIEFATPRENQLVRVFEQDGITVSSFVVDHHPVAPSVGYRIDYAGRSLVISGDTKRSANLEWAASGADVLVHEALSAELVGLLEQAAEEAKRVNIAKIMRDILDYHTSPVDAARSAQTAQAKHLLLTHIVPPLPIAALEVAFLEGVDKVYDGPVTLGKDGTMISLPSNTQSIEVSEILH